MTANIRFEQPLQILRANPQVIQDINQVALQRGPFVYCIEEADNGQALWRCRIDPQALEATFRKRIRCCQLLYAWRSKATKAKNGREQPFTKNERKRSYLVRGN